MIREIYNDLHQFYIHQSVQFRNPRYRLSNGNRTLDWTDYEPRHKSQDYAEYYNLSLESQHYSLIDRRNGLFQILAEEIISGQVTHLKASFSYIPAPKFNAYEKQGIDQPFSVEKNSVHYLRLDIDPLNDRSRHARAHLHVGFDSDWRICIENPMSPSDFIKLAWSNIAQLQVNQKGKIHKRVRELIVNSFDSNHPQDYKLKRF